MANSYSNITGDEIEEARLNILRVRSQRELATDVVDTMTDSEWVLTSFMVGDKDLEPYDAINRTYSSAQFKIEDTSLGGGSSINPRPQFTPYADARIPGLLGGRTPVSVQDTSGNHGLGHYYNESQEETSQIIHMRFGVPEFNPLTTFFTSFYNEDAARLARTGRATPGFMSSLGFATGFIVNIVVWPLLAAHLLGAAYRFLARKPASKYYFLKPTMTNYWMAVTTMVNHIAVNKGLFPRQLEQNTDQRMGDTYKLDTEGMAALANLMPDIFSKSGGIDVYSVANKRQRKKNKLDALLSRISHSSEFDSGDFTGFVKKYQEQAVQQSYGSRNKGIAGAINRVLNKDGSELDNQPSEPSTLAKAIEVWTGSAGGEVKQTTEGSPDIELTMRGQTGTDETSQTWFQSFVASASNHISAEFDDGSQFASFRVDYTGPVSESFSSSVAEIDIAAKFNQISSQGKAAYFSFSGGNLVGGAAGAAFSAVKGALTDFTSGVLDAFQMSGLMALGGSAFVDIPKMWEQSTANLPKTTYTVQLISPYGNPISQMMNLYIPLCMLLAGGLPIATGKQTHGAPFLVELYDRGRQQTRLGIMDSITVTRGVSNLGFNKDGQALAIDVSFSIADLSSIMAMPINGKLNLLNIRDGTFDDETSYTDYMAVLSSLSLDQQIYVFNRMKLGLARKYRSLDVLASPAYWAGILHEKTVIGNIDAFFKGVSK